VASYKEKKINGRSHIQLSSEDLARLAASWYLLRTKITPCCHCKLDIRFSSISSVKFIQQHRTHLDVKFTNNSECVIPVVCLNYMVKVNSVKNTTINIWLNDGVDCQCKNYMFRPISAIFRF